MSRYKTINQISNSNPEQHQVFVAMSGGVDSSVAAALIKEAGFKVVGVFIKPWSSKSLDLDECMWRKDREDALRVASKLDIPLLTWDLSKEYKKFVVDYMIKTYKEGLTPNPDIMCNKFIKFGIFLDKALKLGADYIATGHYIRKKKVESEKGKSREKEEKEIGNNYIFKLFKAKDLNKDQSYFLYTLTQKQLQHCLFPIGDYTKKEVRELAKKFNLPNWDKKDSQGVCFIGSFRMDKFLSRFINPKKGLIIEKETGNVIGSHKGVWFYTLGQRHGFNTRSNVPYYIIDKDIDKNILYASKNIFSLSNKFLLNDVNWIRKVSLPFKGKVKLRYRQNDKECKIKTSRSKKELICELKNKRNIIVPGQAAVFYKNNELLGGGIVAKQNSTGPSCS